MILVVGLSPAWQRALWFDSVRTGHVNRARRLVENTAGKGPNVARIARQLGARSRLLTVAGGHHGKLIQRALAADGVDARIIRVAAETRICQTLISPEGFTELVEEARPLSRGEVAKLLAVFDREIRRARMLVLMGTVPPGCGDDFLARLTRKGTRLGLPVLIDTQTKQLVNAVREKPFLVRLTSHELAEATGLSCGSSGAVLTAGRALCRMGARWVVVSSGPGRVVAVSDSEMWSAMPPKIKAVNPIGSGDAMMTGIAVSLLRGKPMIEALRFGVACGTANALTAAAGMIRRSDVQNLLRRIQ
jgi:1-phosphofructokinase family hexose kinase